MKRKLIAALAVNKVRKKGRVATAFILDDVLILDCYEDKQYMGRYCIQPDGRHLAYIDGKWCVRRLFAMFEMSFLWWSGLKIRYSTPDDEALISNYTKTYFSKYSYSELSDVINDVEHEYNAACRYKAIHRKAERIDNLMSQVPALPNDFESWCRRVAFGGEEYAFYDKTDDKYYCTACGKAHTLKSAKHNEQIVCRRSGKTVTIKRRQQFIDKTERVMIIQQMTPELSIARHFLVDCCYRGGKVSLNPYEEIRITLPRRKKLIQQLADEAVGKKQKQTQPKVYYGQHHRADEFEQDWYDHNPYNKHTFPCYCYPTGVRDALDGTDYAHICIDGMAAAGWKLQYNKLMKYEWLTACYEYLFKGGFRQLVYDTSDEFSDWCYPSYLDLSGKSAQEVLKLDKQRINRLRQADGGVGYLKWLREEQRSGKNIPEDTISWFNKHKITPQAIRFISDRMSPLQVSNYLRRQQEQSGSSPRKLIKIWQDYLSMAERAGMDVNDEIVYRTKDLVRRHDELVERIAAENSAKRVKQFRKNYPTVDRICKSLSLYEMEIGDYMIIKPKGIADIVREGNLQHHCVGSSDIYIRKIAKNESYILFLRKTTEPDKPYYTLEVKPDGTVLQCRAKYNRQPDYSYVKAKLDVWKKELSARLAVERKKTQHINQKSNAEPVPA